MHHDSNLASNTGPATETVHAGLRARRASTTLQRSRVLARLGGHGAELLAPTLGLWEPTGDTRRVLGVAAYVVPAEVALGWAAATAYGLVRGRGLVTQAGAALAVSTFYLGALVLAHFLIDVAGWRLTLT